MTLYWDVPGRVLLRSMVDATVINALQFVARDEEPIRLFLLQQDETGAYVEYTTELSPIFTAKPKAALSGPATVYVPDFAKQEQQENGLGYYVGSVAFLAETLLALLPDGTLSIALLGELTLHDDATWKDTSSCQFDVSVASDVHRGDEVVPDPTPHSMVEGFQAGDGRQGVRIRNASGVIIAEFLPPA